MFGLACMGVQGSVDGIIWDVGLEFVEGMAGMAVGGPRWDGERGREVGRWGGRWEVGRWGSGWVRKWVGGGWWVGKSVWREGGR